MLSRSHSIHGPDLLLCCTIIYMYNEQSMCISLTSNYYCDSHILNNNFLLQLISESYNLQIKITHLVKVCFSFHILTKWDFITKTASSTTFTFSMNGLQCFLNGN